MTGTTRARQKKRQEYGIMSTESNIRTLRTLSAFPLMLILILACTVNKDWDKYYDNSSGQLGINLLDLLKENEDYSLFYQKVVETGYDTILKKNQYFTLFVPENSAFSDIPEYSTEQWKKIIGFHICYQSLFSRDFGNISVLSILGKYLKLTDQGNHSFTVFNASIMPDKMDQTCSNGVIHEINSLLVPRDNIYEYIMNLGDDFSLLRKYINSMDKVTMDYENSTRTGVDENGNTVYDTVWIRSNKYLDNIAHINNENGSYTGFLVRDAQIMQALNNASSYFGNISEMNDNDFLQLLSIAYSATFLNGAYRRDELPDTMVSVEGKSLTFQDVAFSDEINLEMSNGMIHVLSEFNIPKEFFLYPIIIEADNKTGRKLSNTVYPSEIRSDTRATNGTYFYYGSKLLGEYIEFTIDNVLATKYWIIWTSPALGGSSYQVSVDGTNVGGPVDNYYKGNFKPVVAGSYTFDTFGSKRIRMTVVVQTIPGYNSIYLDYFKLIPDELYNP
jgi:uncharacterized surface protein with fasciclin (FAS1) repeats